VEGADPQPVQHTPAEPEPAESVEAEPAVARRRPGYLVLTALVVLLVGLAGLALWFVDQSRSLGPRDDGRQAAVQAARVEAVNLTTISYETADRDLARIIAAATGTLKTQFVTQRKQLPTVLRRDKSISIGTVLAAGVTSQRGNTVKVLVAVDAQVSSAQSTKAGKLVKHYRMDMTLVRISGHWLVSQVGFSGVLR
jgi:Mce-associated membrane protein